MSNERPTLMFRILKKILYTFYPKTTVHGAENLPDESVIIVANHSQMHGPIICEKFLPFDSYTWCTGEMMKLREVPAYAYKDFWSAKPKVLRPFYKVLSYIIAPVSVCVFNNAHTISVYHDARCISAFKETMQKLNDNNNVVIFPECYDEHNHIVHDFQENFINIARMYYRKTGRCLCFAPMYIAPKLHSVYIGKPIRYNPDENFDEHKESIRSYLMDSITQIAVSLPIHTVVPYPNISKKHYPKNKEN